MQKYKQTTVTGDSWVRAKRIVIENVLSSDNVIKFVEERVVNLGDTDASTDLGVLETKVSDADMGLSIPIVNPTTGELTGTSITYGELHAIIFSVYMQLVTERDTPTEVVEEPIDDGAGETA